MTARSILDQEETAKILDRIVCCEQDRAQFATRYNQYLDLVRPWRPRVDKSIADSTPRPPGEQDDIFDTTLQDAVGDFSSDMNDEFTPSYKPWTQHKATQEFKGVEKRKVEDYAEFRMGTIYDTIRASNFEETSEELWVDLGIAPSGLIIGYAPPGQTIPVEHVPIHELLIAPGPYGGVDDRWRKRVIPVKHLDILWPDVDWSDFGYDRMDRAKSRKSALVTHGLYRNWSATEETWISCLIANNKILRRKVYKGRGSCPFIVARTNVSTPTAYGVGPANKALAPARVLDQLAYLFLKRHGRILNPPAIYYDDGIINVEGGIDDGIWIAAGPDFKIQELRPQDSAREVWFTQEDLRMAIRRALFQDKPYQRGDTPPTAAQWLSEEHRAERRKSFPRARIHEELVLPVIRRFEWIMEKRGELEPLQLEGQFVNVEPVSPLSKSADIQEAEIGFQLLQSIGGVMPNALMRIDEGETLNGFKKKMGDRIVKVLDDDAYAQKMQQMAMAQQAGMTGQQ